MAAVFRVTTKRGANWQVRWRDPDGRQRAKTFSRKAQADRYRALVERELTERTYLDPDAGQIRLADWSTTWLKSQGHLKPTTLARYEGVLQKHVLPRWGGYPLTRIRHADVSAWVTRLSVDGHGPATVAYAYRVLSLLLDLAARDGRIARNPAVGVKLPHKRQAEKRFLTHREVSTFADAAGPYSDVILVLAYCGLRWGELAALRVGRVDLERRRLEIMESVTEVRGKLVWGAPKSHQRRSVPFPDLLTSRLAKRVEGRATSDLVFTTPGGAVLRNLNFRRDVFDGAAQEAGLEGITPHELRHTAASLAVRAGVNVKAVQRMLGHASAAMTLDVYSGLFEDDLDEVARRLDHDARVHEMFVTPPPTDGMTEGASP